MVNENGGKEILMRRFIEEQSNGKQIIREHYQVIPNGTFVQTLPNEVHESVVEKQQTQQQTQKDTNLVDSSELESNLKVQNALLRQILLEKEKLQEKHIQLESALETQSLPCNSMTAAVHTQTDCEIAVQTDPMSDNNNGSKSSLQRRRTRSENDDSMSEEDYEYIRYSPPNSPDGIYWIKRRRHRKKSKYKDQPGHKKLVTVESVKRKIRTPIQEENEDVRKTPLKHKETRTSHLRRMKITNDRAKMLQKDLLQEITDSLDDEIIPNIKKKQQKNINYFIEDSDGSENEVILHKNYYSADSLENDYDYDDRINDDNLRRMTESVPPTPAIRQRMGHRDSGRKGPFKSFKVETEPTKIPKAQAPRPPIEKKPFRKDYKDGEMQEVKGAPVPRYMEWYVKNKEITTKNQQQAPVKAKRKNLRNQEKVELKPEPMPRLTPSKEISRMLKEDLEMARKVESRMLSNDALSHPLLQYSEHRFEHEYQQQPSLPIAPAKLPHYMYPNTPPSQSNSDQKINIKYKPAASPIKENEVSKTTTTIKIPIEQNGDSNPNITTTTTTTTTMLNHHQHQPQPSSSQHEDDHDSGIAMNSLLHGKRNKIADKKSVFTIAYDDVQIKRIQMSESEDHSPPLS